METNTGLLVGLGVLGVLIIASLDDGTTVKSAPIPEDKPKEEPKKVIL
ncbi:hypothetical protein [Flavobacterium sp.]